jgi:hypothetical protein
VNVRPPTIGGPELGDVEELECTGADVVGLKRVAGAVELIFSAAEGADCMGLEWGIDVAMAGWRTGIGICICACNI